MARKLARKKDESMQILMVYSESGGATKTATAVSLAMVAAEAGKRVLVIDLDPRGATTKWLDVEPAGEGLDVGAILGNEDVAGWADDLAVLTSFHPNLKVIPSHRSVSTFEYEAGQDAAGRLRASLDGSTAELVVIDCPNRQGGALIRNAMVAADSVVYAATPSADGVDGFLGAQESVRAFKDRTGSRTPEELGVIVAAVKETVMSRNESHSIEEIRAGGDLITPLVPHRAIVGEVRYSHEWYGTYRKGQPVLNSYRELAQKVIRT